MMLDGQLKMDFKTIKSSVRYIAKLRKRCPKCSSSNIYKRSRDSGKVYKCLNCKFEFNKPIVEENILKEKKDNIEKEIEKEKDNIEEKVNTV